MHGFRLVSLWVVVVLHSGVGVGAETSKVLRAGCRAGGAVAGLVLPDPTPGSVRLDTVPFVRQGKPSRTCSNRLEEGTVTVAGDCVSDRAEQRL